MLGKVKTIIGFAKNKQLIKLDIGGSIAKTYVVEGNGNSKKWKDVRVGDCLSGLEWFDEESKIIDADSSINILS